MTPPDAAPDAAADRPVLVERRDSTLLITIDRPGVKNALDLAVAEGIAAALDELDADPALKIGVLTGAGGNFSSGMDLKAFAAGQKPVIEGRGLAGFAEAPPAKPLIAAVEGYALAGGFEVALACDLIVSSREAVFGLPEVRRGLLAAGGGLVRLPRLLPPRVAAEIILTGEFVTAERMAEHGVVSRLTDPGGALDGALDLAAKIAANAPLAVAGARRMLQLAPDLDEAALWEEQRKLNAEVGSSEDALEGARAFAEKRPPEWKGR
ncbi:MAG TPA: crotonase/enoyl-CoA hydratase family protein [Solirubrobacterales bacterium]|nr:crotonase/enoyl-CoA hydratase family protein [Solirubrobacterales bacterium]